MTGFGHAMTVDTENLVEITHEDHFFAILQAFPEEAFEIFDKMLVDIVWVIMLYFQQHEALLGCSSEIVELGFTFAR
jgi:hypothetical protein